MFLFHALTRNDPGAHEIIWLVISHYTLIYQRQITHSVEKVDSHITSLFPLPSQGRTLLTEH